MNSKLLKDIFISFLLSTLASKAFSYEYYCPRSNIVLSDRPVERGRGKITMGFDGIEEPFPQSPGDVRARSGAGKVFFDTTNCSTNEFECLELVQHQTDLKEKKFFLFLPKRIEVDREYKFRDMKLITRVAAISPYMNGEKSKIPSVQATIWQNIHGIETPIKLTIEKNRGTIFVDGLDFDPEKSTSGELCVLRGKRGIFAGIRIEEVILKAESLE